MARYPTGQPPADQRAGPVSLPIRPRTSPCSLRLQTRWFRRITLIAANSPRPPTNVPHAPGIALK